MARFIKFEKIAIWKISKWKYSNFLNEIRRIFYQQLRPEVPTHSARRLLKIKAVRSGKSLSNNPVSSGTLEALGLWITTLKVRWPDFSTAGIILDTGQETQI